MRIEGENNKCVFNNRASIFVRLLSTRTCQRYGAGKQRPNPSGVDRNARAPTSCAMCFSLSSRLSLSWSLSRNRRRGAEPLSHSSTWNETYVRSMCVAFVQSNVNMHDCARMYDTSSSGRWGYVVWKRVENLTYADIYRDTLAK